MARKPGWSKMNADEKISALKTDLDQIYDLFSQGETDETSQMIAWSKSLSGSPPRSRSCK